MGTHWERCTYSRCDACACKRAESPVNRRDLLCLCPSLFIKAHRGALDDVTAGGGIITNISISALVRFSKKKNYKNKSGLAVSQNKKKLSSSVK